jgi:hypothetical protein
MCPQPRCRELDGTETSLLAAFFGSYRTNLNASTQS